MTGGGLSLPFAYGAGWTALRLERPPTLHRPFRKSEAGFGFASGGLPYADFRPPSRSLTVAAKGIATCRDNALNLDFEPWLC